MADVEIRLLHDEVDNVDFVPESIPEAVRFQESGTFTTLKDSSQAYEVVSSITSYTDIEDLVNQVVNYIKTKIGNNAFTRTACYRGKNINYFIKNQSFISGIVYANSPDSTASIWGILFDEYGGTWRFYCRNGGADTVTPFKSSGGELKRVYLGSGNTFTSCTFSAISIPNYQSLTLDNFALIVTGINYGKDGSQGSGSYSYDPSTGTLRIIGTTCVKQVLNGDYKRFYALYDVYCYYTD